MNDIKKIFQFLLNEYGPQGWWPLIDINGKNPTKTNSIRGYHPGDYSYPKNEKQKFEICVGAILTQNTAWPNVEKALINLRKINSISARKIIDLSDAKLKKAIRPAGYYNQKAKKLKIFSKFYIALKGKTPSRTELLSVWGIGKETADSILLYAYKEPIFVVDTYTKRIFSHLRLIKPDDDYDDIRKKFEINLPKDYKIYQEFHALIVEHAKRCYGKKKEKNCFLKKSIS
ncbi:MAG: endonuclease III domain-containing protein [Candidatus Woesearchaeota archaeon]